MPRREGASPQGTRWQRRGSPDAVMPPAFIRGWVAASSTQRQRALVASRAPEFSGPNDSKFLDDGGMHHVGPPEPTLTTTLQHILKRRLPPFRVS